jgi:hypothetical protein
MSTLRVGAVRVSVDSWLTLVPQMVYLKGRAGASQNRQESREDKSKYK